MFVITLEDLRFHARIGVAEQERAVGNEFSVDVSFAIDSSSFRSETLADTISYADVYEVVRQIMMREWQLLESVAKHIGDSIGERWPQAQDISVKVSKLAPPIAGLQGICSVRYTR